MQIIFRVVTRGIPTYKETRACGMCVVSLSISRKWLLEQFSIQRRLWSKEDSPESHIS